MKEDITFFLVLWSEKCTGIGGPFEGPCLRLFCGYKVKVTQIRILVVCVCVRVCVCLSTFTYTGASIQGVGRELGLMGIVVE